MRKALVLGTLASTVVCLALAVPASAGDTVVTFSVDGGATLAIAVTPTSVVGAGTSTITGTLGPTVVTDTRLTGSSWSYQVSSTPFTLFNSNPAVTVPAANAKVFVAAPVVTIPGTATVNSYTAVDAASGLALTSTPTTLFSVTRTNANTVSFTPGIAINVAGAAVGVYTGTVTQTAI